MGLYFDALFARPTRAHGRPHNQEMEADLAEHVEAVGLDVIAVELQFRSPGRKVDGYVNARDAADPWVPGRCRNCYFA